FTARAERALASRRTESAGCARAREQRALLHEASRHEDDRAMRRLLKTDLPEVHATLRLRVLAALPRESRLARHRDSRLCRPARRGAAAAMAQDGLGVCRRVRARLRPPRPVDL